MGGGGEQTTRRDCMHDVHSAADDDGGGGGGIDVGRHAFFAADSQSVDGLGDHVVGRFRTAATTRENVSKHVL